MTAAPLSVELRDVHLAFGRNRVLRGVDLEVPAGSTTCVIGPSGSGKSTLLRVVNRLLEPDQGDVLLDGRSILRDDPDQLRRHVGMVFQHFNLFPHKTVADNVALGPRKLLGLSRHEARSRALTHLESVGLAHKADVRPSSLSGGQQQRVAVARALVMRPRVIFADEPTGALDSVTGHELLDFLRRCVRELGQTVVMVTHDPGAATYADRVLLLADGRMAGELRHPTADDVLAALRGLGA